MTPKLHRLEQQLHAHDRDWAARQDSAWHTARWPVVVPDVLGELTPPPASPPSWPDHPTHTPGLTIPRRSPPLEPFRPAPGRGHSRGR